jgi:multidrug efflux pump subunit AcrA (membrane-fusion protein)
MSPSQSFFQQAARLAVPLAILAAGIGGFMVFGQRPRLARRPDSGPQIPIVKTDRVESFERAIILEVEGVAVPFRQVTLSAEVAGRITQKDPKCRAGSYVEQDDFLVQIDPTDYDLEVRRLQIELQQADEDIQAVQIDITSAESLIELASESLVLQQRELARRKVLYKKKAVSESELDEGQRLELSSRHSLQSLQNQAASLRQRRRTLDAARELVNVNLERAQVDVRRTRVVSPVVGTIVEDLVEQDSYVAKGDPLVRLNETSRMEIQCSLSVDQIYWLWLQAGILSPDETASPQSLLELPQTPVTVAFAFDGIECQWDGVLSRYEGDGLDRKTRMVPCRVRIDQPTHVRTHADSPRKAGISLPALFSGMYVTVRIPVQPSVPLLSMPPAALRPGGQVWVLRDGKLWIELVDRARIEENRVLVRPSMAAGLTIGDQVITSPLPHVVRGMSVAQESLP